MVLELPVDEKMPCGIHTSSSGRITVVKFWSRASPLAAENDVGFGRGKVIMQNQKTWELPLWSGFCEIQKDQVGPQAIHHLMESVHQNGSNTQAVWVNGWDSHGKGIRTRPSAYTYIRVMPRNPLQKWGQSAWLVHGPAWYVMVAPKNRWWLHCRLSHLEQYKRQILSSWPAPLYRRLRDPPNLWADRSSPVKLNCF